MGQLVSKASRWFTIGFGGWRGRCPVPRSLATRLICGVNHVSLAVRAHEDGVGVEGEGGRVGGSRSVRTWGWVWFRPTLSTLSCSYSQLM